MNFRVLLNRAPSSTQLISVSTDFFSTPSALLKPEYHMYLGNFPKIRQKDSKMSVLLENWYTWYLESAHSESALRFLKFWPQNPFFGKCEPKSKTCLFCPQIGAHNISRMLILIPTLVFWVSNLKSIFG